MATITYPDGSQLTSTALTVSQIETAFQIITAQMLGILTSPWALTINLVEGQFVMAVNSLINLYAGELISATGLPVGTVISGFIGGNVSFSNAATATGTIDATATDPNVGYKVRIGWQTEGQPGPPISEDTVALTCVPIDTPYGRVRDIVGSLFGNTVTQTDVFTRAWKTTWIFYGTNSLDNARAVRSALDTIQFVADYLADFNLYVNPSIKEPARAPQEFQGRWWERVDLEVEFNEQVTETFTVGTVGSVEVNIQTDTGQTVDFTVTD